MPVTVDVITYAPTVFFHCQHCEVTFQEMGLGERLRRDSARSALPDDLARDYQELSDWIHALLIRHGRGLRIRVIDAMSIEGVVASIRHRAWSYPAVVVDGRDKRIGREFAALDPLIDRRLAAEATAQRRVKEVV